MTEFESATNWVYDLGGGGEGNVRLLEKDGQENKGGSKNMKKKTTKKIQIKRKVRRRAQPSPKNKTPSLLLLLPSSLSRSLCFAYSFSPNNKKTTTAPTNPTQPNPTKEKKNRGHATCRRTMPPLRLPPSLLIQTPHHPTPLTTLLPQSQNTQPLPHTPPDSGPHRRKPTTPDIRRRTLDKNPPLPPAPLRRRRRRPTPKTIPPGTPPPNSRTPPHPGRVRHPVHPRATPHQRPARITPRPAAHVRRRVPVRRRGRRRAAEETPSIPGAAELALLALVVISVDLGYRWWRRRRAVLLAAVLAAAEEAQARAAALADGHGFDGLDFLGGGGVGAVGEEGRG